MPNKQTFLFNRVLFLWGLVILVSFFHLIISISDSPGFWTDNFIYLLQADYFSFWNTEHLPVVEQAITYRNYPPLYPCFLSMLGGGSDAITLASIVTSALLLPFSLLYVNWQTKNGMAEYNALLNSLLFLLLPVTLLLSTEIWSENLYIFFTILTLWSFQKTDGNSDKWLYLSAFSCGLSIITRTAGITLAIALIIAIYHRDKQKLFNAIILISIPSILWFLVSRDINYEETYLKHGFIDRYKIFIDAYGGGLSGLIKIIQNQLQGLWTGLQSQFHYSNNTSTVILAVVIIITAGFSLFSRLMNLSIDALYVLIYSGLIFVWNHPDHNARFIYTIIPFVLFYSQLTISSILDEVKANSNIRVMMISFIPLLVFITILPPLILMTGRFVTTPGKYYQHISNDRIWLTGDNIEMMYSQLIFKKKLIDSAVEIQEIVASDECIYSINREIIMLYSKRVSHTPPLRHVNQEEFLNGLRHCRYLFVTGTPYANHEPLYPVDRVRDISWVQHQSFYPSDYGGGIISALLEIDGSVDK